LPADADIPADVAHITEYQDTRVVVNATALQRGLLVLGDQFHPGWKARLDGRPVNVLRVNQILRGVLVPPGDHKIVFEFAPSSLSAGILLGIAGMTLVGMMIAFDIHPRIARWLGRKERADSSEER
jgi:uncharacterized membrane protein YfhO